jgi:chromosome segregation ATPase
LLLFFFRSFASQQISLDFLRYLLNFLDFPPTKMSNAFSHHFLASTTTAATTMLSHQMSRALRLHETRLACTTTPLSHRQLKHRVDHLVRQYLAKTPLIHARFRASAALRDNLNSLRSRISHLTTEHQQSLESLKMKIETQENTLKSLEEQLKNAPPPPAADFGLLTAKQAEQAENAQKIHKLNLKLEKFQFRIEEAEKTWAQMEMVDRNQVFFFFLDFVFLTKHPQIETAASQLASEEADLGFLTNAETVRVELEADIQRLEARARPKLERLKRLQQAAQRAKRSKQILEEKIKRSRQETAEFHHACDEIETMKPFVAAERAIRGVKEQLHVICQVDEDVRVLIEGSLGQVLACERCLKMPAEVFFEEGRTICSGCVGQLVRLLSWRVDP